MFYGKFNITKNCFKYHSTRSAVDIARLQVMKELLPRLPKHSRIVAVLWCLGDCFVHHHLLQCRRQHVDAILLDEINENGGKIENYSRSIMLLQTRSNSMSAAGRGTDESQIPSSNNFKYHPTRSASIWLI